MGTLKNFITFLSVFGFALFSSAAGVESSAADLEFVSLEKGINSAFGRKDGEKSTEVQLLVFNSSDAFSDFLAKHHANRVPVPPVPEIDFTKEMVVAVIDTPHQTGGYSVEVKGVQESETALLVKAVKTSPAPGCMVPQVFTRPYHIIKTAKSEKQLFLSFEEIINYCR